MGLLTILKKLKQKEKEMRLLILYLFDKFFFMLILTFCDVTNADYRNFQAKCKLKLKEYWQTHQ